MKINKSSRHSKITGDFGESVILYWLSKYGFECAIVDHTGIDIIARNPHVNEVMGISVKSRCRNKGAEGECVTIRKSDFDKTKAACAAFKCVPYFAVVIDAGNTIRGFILSMDHLLKLFPQKTASYWKMGKKYLEQYSKDPKIKTFVFTTETTHWW